MKKFPILYSRTNTGATQSWQIIADGDSYYTISGQIDGKKTQSKPSLCLPKNVGKANETSASEQALAESSAKWEKKYKTGYTDDINKIDDCTHFIEPMLAKSLDDYIDKIDFSKGALVQNKYNGVRCVATLEKGKVILRSRKGEEWVSVPHINKDMEAFFKDFPEAVADGELYNYELREKLNDLIHLVRQTKDITAEEFAESEKTVRFYVYDGYNPAINLGEDASYTERKKWLEKTLSKYCKYYRAVKTWEVTSMAEVEQLYGQFLEDGEEGAIIRFLDSPYIHNRSKLLLKYKPEDSDEGKILDVLEGTGNYAGIAKKALIEWKGKTFHATFMGKQAQGREILKNKKDWINKIRTFKYTGVTGLQVPNYARIDPDNCLRAESKL